MTAECRSKLFDVVWLLGVGLAATAWCAAAWAEVGVTFDEPGYLNSGLIAWRTGSNKQLMTWGTMPFPVDVMTLPLYLMERWVGEPFQAYFQLEDLLPVARAATLPFFWLLIVYGLRWGRLIGGPWAGRLASALIAADPNLIGHAALATTDICLSAIVLVATYHFFTGRDCGWIKRVLIPGVLYGVAMTSKASALPYVPLLCGVLGTWHLWKTGQLDGLFAGGAMARFHAARVATVRLRWDLAYMMAVGLVWTFAYTGCDWGVEPSFVEWAEQLPSGRLKDVMLPLSERLTIFPNAGEALVQQIKHNIRGHDGAYLLGTYHKRAVWYYFPVALSVKLPDATLALFAAVLLLRPRGLWSPAGLMALVLLAFSLNTRVQIGVRIVFPCVCFLYVALTAAVFRPNGAEPFAGWRAWLLKALACLAVAANAAAAVAAWPDGLRYANQLHGGPDAGERLLADSNYDWGQGVPELRRWWAAHGQPTMRVWYYGGDTASMLPPFGALNMCADPDRTPEALVRRVGGGHFAVSVAILRACPDRRPETLALIDWLNAQEPVGRTPLFVVYHFPK